MDIKHQSIILDVNKLNILPNIIAHQGDQKTRFIDVTLTMSGEELILNDSYRAILKASNNGEVKAINDCEIDLEQNIIIVELTSTMLDSAGYLNCEITVVDEDKYITSQSFLVEVSLSTISEDKEIESSKEYGTLVKLMNEVSKIESDAKVVKDIISHLAEITDIDTLVNSKADKADVEKIKSTVESLESTKADITMLDGKENVSNKINSINFPSTTYYPSTKGVWDFVNKIVSSPLSDIEDLKNQLAEKETELNKLKIKNTTEKANCVVINDSSDSNIVNIKLYNTQANLYMCGKNFADFNTYFKKAEPWDRGTNKSKIVVTKDAVNKTITFNSVNDTDRSGINVFWKDSGIPFSYLTNKTITVSVDVSSTDDCKFFLCNSCDNYKNISVNTTANKVSRVALTTKMPSDVSSIKDTSILLHVDSSMTTVTLSNFQIELSSTATDYENYKESQTVTNTTDMSTVHTYYPTTTIISDSDFEVTYIADPKNYIDSKVG